MKIFALSFFLWTCLLVTNHCRAQEAKREHPVMAVKWSSLHLIYFYPSLQVAFEHKVAKNITLQYDLGLVFNPPDNLNESYRKRRGFRGIAELRYYLPSPPKVPFYAAGEFYSSRINFDRSYTLGFDCLDGECLYFRYDTYKVRNKQQGIGLKYGILLFPGWNKHRSFFFDFNAGVAFRSIRYHEVGKPRESNITFFGNEKNAISFSPDEDDRREFRPILGIRLGYSFLPR